MENKMNQSKQKRILLRAVIIVVCLAGYIMLVRVLNSVEKTEMVSMKGYSYQKAVVTEVVRDNLTEDGQRAGYQYLKVKLLKETSMMQPVLRAIFSVQSVQRGIR